MKTGPVGIRVSGLHKTFRVPEHRIHTLKERALHPFRGNKFEEFEILKGIDFEVLQGEFFGIVGRNGSGKSTLLKCLAGIYRVDGGTIEVAGRLSPFIELGVGFNPDLTARDNILINAVMMGLTPRQARDRLDEIVSFAELERFVDQKLKNYSSGMQVRLAFSVMVQSDPDVLLIDEVLAVGDAAFQQKCVDVFYRLRAEGKTIILVTHEMSLVERFCHRALKLSGGHITHIGDPAEIGRAYMTENFSSYSSEEREGSRAPEVRIVNAWVTDSNGAKADAIPFGQWFGMTVVLEVLQPISQPGISLWLTSEDGVRVFSAGAREDGEALSDMEPGEVVEFSVAVRNPLSAGRYFVGCGVTRGTAGLEILLFQNRATDVVSYGVNLHGLVSVDMSPALTRTRPDRETVS
ncbi:MAG TPA: ABC transporter ATP-binding protein [Solirubrobacteraceae bacterium]|jgi:ABC-type polysaccharide/polyol phosphate transport system ATPase subunit